MKLTSRLMQSALLSVGLAAVPSFATDYVSDTFEKASNGQLATTYFGEGDSQTQVWFGEDSTGGVVETLGVITNEAYTFSDCTLPVATATHTNVLVLSTEGGTLLRKINGNTGVSAQTQALWVDTMIKFVKSDEAPTLSGTYKMAFFVNGASNLVIVSGLGYVTNSTALLLDNWYRLTVKQFYDEEVFVDGLIAEVKLNGTLVSSGSTTYGDYFTAADSAAELKSIAFQGTGEVDDLVVTDVEPTYGATAIMITLTGDANVIISTNSVTVTSGAQVPTGTQVSLAFNDWYEFDSMTATDVTVSETAPVAGDRTASFKVEATAADKAVAIVSRKYVTTDTPVSFGSGGPTADAAKVAAWATDKGVSAATVAANANNAFNCFLYNVSANSICGLSIGSIAVSGTKATITLVAKVNGTAVELNTVTANGYLNVKLFDTLGGTATEKHITLEQGVGTTTIDMGTAKFIQAEVNATAATTNADN